MEANASGKRHIIYICSMCICMHMYVCMYVCIMQFKAISCTLDDGGCPRTRIGRLTVWSVHQKTIERVSFISFHFIFILFSLRFMYRYQDALAAASDVGTENVSNARIMKSFAAEELATHQYNTKVDASYTLGAKRALGYGLFVGGLGSMANFAIIVVIYYGAVLVLNGELSVGSLTAFVMYTILIAMGMGLLGGLYSDFMNAVGATERYFMHLLFN